VSSTKQKLKVKLKHRPPSAKKKDADDSDEEGQYESEEDARPTGRKGGKRQATPKKKAGKSASTASVEQDELSSDAREFDDGLDDEYIGDDEDRAKLENMTERERELELFKRAENRENLKKR